MPDQGANCTTSKLEPGIPILPISCLFLPASGAFVSDGTSGVSNLIAPERFAKFFWSCPSGAGIILAISSIEWHDSCRLELCRKAHTKFTAAGSGGEL